MPDVALHLGSYNRCFIFIARILSRPQVSVRSYFFLFPIMFASATAVFGQDQNWEQNRELESAVDPIKTWVADLNSSQFTLRQAANKGLIEQGLRAVPALVEACETATDRESITRSVHILSQIALARDMASSRAAESALERLSTAADKSLASLAKNALDRWRLDISYQTVNRLKKLGASVGHPTVAADGSPEVYLHIQKKDWKGSDSDLELLPDLGRIGLFEVDQAPIGNEGLKFLVKCRWVEKVHLNQTKVDARGLEIIAKAPGLRQLLLKGVSNLDRSALQSLGNLETLEYLSLDSTPVVPEMLPAISKIKSLQRIDLSRSGLSDDGLGFLADLPKLQFLNLSGAVIEGDAEDKKRIAGLANAPMLDTINLRASQLGPQSFAAIGKLAQVRYLILDEVDLSSADFSELAGMKNLRRLDVADCQINDNFARSLSSLTNLVYLELRKNQVSPEVRDEIVKVIPKLQIRLQ
jgi:hypothetical protein